MTTIILYDNFIYENRGDLIFKTEFYTKVNGRKPVQEFIKTLPLKLATKTLHDIELLKNNDWSSDTYVDIAPVRGKKYKGIFELRTKQGSDIVRIFYFTYFNNTYVLLHGFLKKTIKTPKRELEIARKYKDDYIRRHSK